MESEGAAIPTRCQRCSEPLGAPIVCSRCRWLNPASPRLDFFALLGVPRRYDLDEKELARVYRNLVRSIHPDRFAGQSEEVQLLATRWSAEVNRAVEVLRDSVRRAEYLLDQSGGPAASELRDVPVELLSEVLAWREGMEHGGSGLDRLRSEIAGRREDQRRRIAESARRLPDVSPEERKELRRMLNSMRYFDNLLTELAADPLAVASDDSHDA